jgi:hypothetical protein
MLNDFEITDATTREELIARVNDLDEEVQKLETSIDEEVQKLETSIKDKDQEIEDLRLAPKQRERLEEAADEWAAWGRIHNTPHAKAQWVAGQ